MHVIHRTKAEEPRPFIPTQSHWAVPGHRKTRNKRYNARGAFIGYTKPKPTIDLVAQAAVKAAFAEAATKGKPEDGAPFDLNTFRPMPRHVLVTRGAMVKEEGGVALPEDKWFYKREFIVVRVGEGVTACAVGDRVLFGRGFRPAEVKLGAAKLYLGREQAVVGILET